MRRSTRNYAIAIAFSVAFIGYQLWPADPPETIVVSKPDPVMTEAEAFAAARAELGLESVPDTRAMQRVEQSLRTDTLLSIEQIDADLAAVMQLGEFGVVRERLLQYAADAVESGDRVLLGGVLSLLGQVAIEEQDLDTAEVYLLESLEKSRQMARTAGTAYDRLLVARWQISRQDYGSAAENLRQVIEDSLSINRFGAAASAYESLARVHVATGAIYEAEEASMQAASLYASSGQPDRARTLLSSLADVEQWRVAAIEEEIDRNYAEFKNSVEQIERARDYQRLYHHYQAKGDERRAWRLRLLAGQSLAKASKRAMYHRQPDVLAVLYNSNVAKEQAQDYFTRARRTFDDSGPDILNVAGQSFGSSPSALCVPPIERLRCARSSQ
jgi:hypothetical protein